MDNRPDYPCACEATEWEAESSTRWRCARCGALADCDCETCLSLADRGGAA